MKIKYYIENKSFDSKESMEKVFDSRELIDVTVANDVANNTRKFIRGLKVS